MTGKLECADCGIELSESHIGMLRNVAALTKGLLVLRDADVAKQEEKSFVCTPCHKKGIRGHLNYQL